MAEQLLKMFSDDMSPIDPTLSERHSKIMQKCRDTRLGFMRVIIESSVISISPTQDGLAQLIISCDGITKSLEFSENDAVDRRNLYDSIFTHFWKLIPVVSMVHDRVQIQITDQYGHAYTYQFDPTSQEEVRMTAYNLALQHPGVNIAPDNICLAI